MPNVIERVTLQNQFVKMEPIGHQHVDGLIAAGQDRELWKYMPVTLDEESHVQQFIQYTDHVHAQGEGLYFVVRDIASDTIVGATGYWNGDLNHRRMEIGFTWITPQFQRTYINTSCKILLMTHGFETLELNRIEFKTDALNTRSQNALKRIGAKQEGTLRQHMIQPDGRLRDSMYFSVIREEWPQVKENLERMLMQAKP